MQETGTSSSWWRGFRLAAVALVLATLAFLAGTHLIPTITPAPLVHPITGRQIAGLATDAHWLDRGERVVEEAPDEALALIGIRPGMTVADVGAGSGYMTGRLARLVGPTGRVYANDIQTQMVRRLDDKVRAEHWTNVEVVLGTETDANLPEGAIDLVLLVDVYHEMRRPADMLQSIRQSLKAGGEVVFVEYRKEDPTIPIADSHRMSIAEVRTEVEAEHFVFDRVVPGLPRQHIIVFRRGTLPERR